MTRSQEEGVGSQSEGRESLGLEGASANLVQTTKRGPRSYRDTQQYGVKVIKTTYLAGSFQGNN